MSKAPEGMMGSPLVGVIRLVAYLLWALLLVPIQMIVLALYPKRFLMIPRLFHRGVLTIFGLEVVILGSPSQAKPTLFISNHSSYLDIEILGAVLEGSFVAKSEVAGWPLFGFLSKLQRTVFINRKAKRDIDKQRDSMTGRLDEGDSLILFPEGTSSDGNRVLPFKTALFSVASYRIDGQPVTVQPLSVTAVALDGMPLGRLMRPLYAWYGDMDLAPHLWQLAKLGGLTIVVEFHPPVTIEGFTSRKALADHCQQVVGNGVSRAVSGRFEHQESAAA